MLISHEDNRSAPVQEQILKADEPDSGTSSGSAVQAGASLMIIAVVSLAVAAALFFVSFLVLRDYQRMAPATASDSLPRLIGTQTILAGFLFLLVLFIAVVMIAKIRIPLKTMVKKMQKQEQIIPAGVKELRMIAGNYNRILEENRLARERLSHEASHDPLTGLFNRGAYDLLMKSADQDHIALLLIDVDSFKSINDTYGHAAGDRVLKRVADILRRSFRSVDILCRIGGDEFAVVMTRVNSSAVPLVINKIHRVNEQLQHPEDDLPAVSVSVGAAFSDRANPGGDIFADADTALYRVKQSGRRGCQIYE